MDMSLSKLQELVIDRVAYRVAVHEVTKYLWKWCTRKCIISFLWNFYQKCMTWVRTWRIIWWTLFGAPAIGFKACLLETTGIRKGNPLQYACMENSMDRGGLWATVHGVSKRWTRLNNKQTSHMYGLFIMVAQTIKNLPATQETQARF